MAKKKAMAKDQGRRAQQIYIYIFGLILLAAMRQALTIYPPLFCLASFYVFKWCKKRKRKSPTASVCTLLSLF
jgi:hypothetical protein